MNNQFNKEQDKLFSIQIEGLENFKNSNIEVLNADIKEWASKVQTDIKLELATSVQNSNRLSKSIAFAFKKTQGEITRLSLRFSREGIYIHHGASRGHGGIVGSKWMNPYGRIVETNSKSFGKMGIGNRDEKPFIQNVLEKNIDELGEIVANYLGSISIKMYNPFN